MDNKNKNNYIRTLFFVAISFLYLTVFEDDIYGSVNYSHASVLTNIEVIFQPELPKNFQPYKSSSSLKQKKAYGSFYLDNIIKCRKELFLPVNTISSIYLNIQNKSSLPLHHVISILQKNNTWHQSSDDDAFLNDYC